LEKHLHIVCLDVPYPVDYGGVFDLFYKIVSLHDEGVKIHLHCFEYGRGEQPELNKYCVEVKYYPRRTGHKSISHQLPYIVCSRADNSLVENLLQDDYPILLEGIHCSYPLLDKRFENRKIFLRLHNVEYQYYRQLSKSTSNLFRKFYYLHESKLLKNYESEIANKCMIIAVSQQDVQLYKEKFGARNIRHLPVFLPFNEVKAREGVGCFCLYHGNLSVAENEKAALWLLDEVFADLRIPLVIAGKDPSNRLNKLTYRQKNTCLVADPSSQEMQDMISKAQINILPSFNETGIKLKLLNALYNGRHCVVNEAMVNGTGLEATCHTGNNADALKSIIVQLYNHPFAEEEMRLRKTILPSIYNNKKNAQQLIQWIW
jgi:glycosyl transferase family 1